MQALYSFDMRVIIDVVLTVAVVTLAAGAVAELQLRMRYICAAADGAFMRIRHLGFCNGGLVRTGIGEGDGLCLLLAGRLAEQPPRIHPPGNGLASVI